MKPMGTGMEKEKLPGKSARVKGHSERNTPTGRPPDPRPRDGFEAEWLARYGPEISPFLHRDRQELQKLHHAVTFKGYPPQDLEKLRQKLQKEGLSKKEIARRIGIIGETTDRNGFASLLIQRFREGDAEFFRLLSIVVNNPRYTKLHLDGLAKDYIQMTRTDGHKATERGFISFLRAGPFAFQQARRIIPNSDGEVIFEPTYKGFHVRKISQKVAGKVDPKIIHPEEARRSFRRMSSYLEG